MPLTQDEADDIAYGMTLFQDHLSTTRLFYGHVDANRTVDDIRNTLYGVVAHCEFMGIRLADVALGTVEAN